MSTLLRHPLLATTDDALAVAAFEAASDALIVLDAAQRVQRVNAAAAQLLGPDTSGRQWSDFVHGETASAGVPGASEGLITLRVASGEAPAFKARRTRLADDHTLITLRAEPAVTHLQQALEQSEQRLAAALTHGQVGLFDWDVQAGTLREFGHWVGLTAHTELGADISVDALANYTHPDDLERVRAAALAHLRGSSEHYEVEQRVRLRDGGYVRLLVRGRAVARDEQGRVTRILGTYTDITATREQEQLLKFALEHSRQGIWEWRIKEDRVVEYGYWRPHLEEYAVTSPTPRLGFLAHVHPDDAVRLQQAQMAHIRGLIPAVDLEIRLRRKDGSYGYFLIRGRAPERDAAGRCERVLGTYTEISALKADADRLQIALENGRQGLWDWAPDEDRIQFSRQWYTLFGYPAGSITTHRDHVQRILHPDDSSAGRAALVPLLKGERDNFQVEHRFRHRDGHYLNVLSRGRVVERDAQGRARRVIGTHVDITALKAVETRLRESQRLLETVISAFPLRLFWKDHASRYLGCSDLFARDVGLANAAAIVGLSDDDLPWRARADLLRADDRRVMEGADPRITVQREVRVAGGDDMWVETTKAAIRDGNGDVFGVLGVYDDITQRHAREEQIQIIADALTSGDQTRLLETVARAAALLSGATLAFVSRLNGDGSATVTASYPHDRTLDNLRYTLADTACGDAVERGGCFIASNICVRYPNDAFACERGYAAYAGQPLRGRDGAIVGLFALMFAHEVVAERVRPVLGIFATRAAIELERESTHGELLAHERRLNAAIEGAGQGLWEWDIETDALSIFGSHYATLGRADDGSVRTAAQVAATIRADDRDAFATALRGYLRGQRRELISEVRFENGSGSTTWTLVRGRAATYGADGRIRTMLGTYTDVTALKASQAALSHSQQFLELVINTVPQAVFWQDLNGRYVGCNQRFATFARVADPQQLIGQGDDALWWSAASSQYRLEDRALLDGSTSHIAHETPITNPDGTRLWVEFFKVPMRDPAGQIVGVLGVLHDITTRKSAEEHAQRLSLYDPLTNLPNRRYFTERLKSNLASAVRHARCGALLFIDLDQFKRINDTLGHSVGDALLQAVAGRLQNVTRQEDMVARIGGDEFVVLLPNLGSDIDSAAHQARQAALKIHHSLGQPFQFDHHQFHVTPTIGIAMFPMAGKGAEEVLREADTAMYSGKSAGRNVTRFFEPAMEQNAQQRLRIESDLRTALARDELRLVYQPLVDTGGRVSGGEVLLRWQHPERGPISPVEFIPVAEERGLIIDIGRWVLQHAFAELSRWLADGTAPPGALAINVSSRQFRDERFIDDVEALLREYRLPRGRVLFELTESAVIEDVAATIAIMTRLREIGIGFALDDFGVGYSSLSYLKRLPIDQLKIDRSFIADIGADRNDEAICTTIIAMGRHLGLETVAEGVENSAQYEFLKQLGCQRYQGFLFLPPAPAPEFLRYCARARAT